jgi:hypothetical protein
MKENSDSGIITIDWSSIRCEFEFVKDIEGSDRSSLKKTKQ